MIQQIDNLIVSIVISAYNEEKYLPGLIEDLKRQTYSKENIEILFINAMSTDKTTDIIQRFISEDTEFRSIRLYDNPKKNQASGFNLGIKNSNGDLILKIDAHSKVTEDFVKNNVEIINQGEYVCGGPRPTLVEGEGKWSQALHIVEENMFGSSIADYRNSSQDRYVSSIFHGMYRRGVFEQAEAYLLKAQENADDQEEILLRLATIYQEQERYEDILALEAYEPENLLTKWMIARSYQETEELDPAYELYNELATELKDNPEFLEQYIYLLRELGKLEEATDYIQAYLDLVPDDIQMQELYNHLI